MLASGAGALRARRAPCPGPTVFLAMAALVGVGVGRGAARARAAPAPRRRAAAGGAPALASRRGCAPRSSSRSLDFVGRRGWVAILLLALLYKFGDAVSGQMASPFYYDMRVQQARGRERHQGVEHRRDHGGHRRRAARSSPASARSARCCSAACSRPRRTCSSARSRWSATACRCWPSRSAPTASRGGLAVGGASSPTSRGSATSASPPRSTRCSTSLMAGGRTVLSAGSGWLAAAARLGGVLRGSRRRSRSRACCSLLWLMRLGEDDRDRPSLAELPQSPERVDPRGVAVAPLDLDRVAADGLDAERVHVRGHARRVEALRRRSTRRRSGRSRRRGAARARRSGSRGRRPRRSRACAGRPVGSPSASSRGRPRLRRHGAKLLKFEARPLAKVR